MKKNIGITCDSYKANKFRERFQKEDFNIVSDKKLSELTDVHMFRIECEEEAFPETVKRLSNVLRELEIEIKHSN